MTLNEYLNKPSVAEWWAGITGLYPHARNTRVCTVRRGVMEACVRTYTSEKWPADIYSADAAHLSVFDLKGTEGMPPECVVIKLRDTAKDLLAKSTKDTVGDILAERGARYGTFAQNGALYHALKTLLTTEKASPVQQMCLDMIAVKLSRMINGDINYRDNWVDIIGYCKGALGEGDE